jgi:hypothetical protein
MARYYQVRQRQDNRRFDMTVSSDDEGWCHPIGYCAGWREYSAENYPSAKEYLLSEIQRDLEKRRPFQAKYHDGGHETREEADACYRDYELDQELRFYDLDDEQHKCALCGAWTQKVAELGQFHRYFHLCPEHANREGVEQARRAKSKP